MAAKKSTTSETRKAGTRPPKHGPDKPREASAEPQASRTFAYLRVSTGAQDVDTQKLGIVDYSRKHSLPIARWFEETASGKLAVSDRVLGKQVLPALQHGDALIVSEISRLGRSLVDILNVLKTLADRGVHVHAVKQGGLLGNGLNAKVVAFAYGLAAEIEHDLISQRVKEGQARAKAEGKRIGRPKATVHVSKLDQHADLIREYAKRGVSKLNLARVFSCDWTTMNGWLRRHEVTIARRAR